MNYPALSRLWIYVVLKIQYALRSYAVSLDWKQNQLGKKPESRDVSWIFFWSVLISFICFRLTPFSCSWSISRNREPKYCEITENKLIKFALYYKEVNFTKKIRKILKKKIFGSTKVEWDHISEKWIYFLKKFLPRLLSLITAKLYVPHHYFLCLEIE